MAQGPRLTTAMEMPCAFRAGRLLRFTPRSWNPSTRSLGAGPPSSKTKSSLSKAVIFCCKLRVTPKGFHGDIGVFTVGPRTHTYVYRITKICQEACLSLAFFLGQQSRFWDKLLSILFECFVPTTGLQSLRGLR